MFSDVATQQWCIVNRNNARKNLYNLWLSEFGENLSAQFLWVTAITISGNCL